MNPTTTPNTNLQTALGQATGGATGTGTGTGLQTAQQPTQPSQPFNPQSSIPAEPNLDGLGWQQKADTLYSYMGEFDKKAKSAIDIYNEAIGHYGVNDMRTKLSEYRTALTNTQNAIRNVEGDVKGRTQEYNLSENQRKRLTQQEQEPLTEALRTQNEVYGNTQADLESASNQAKMVSEYQFQDQQAKREALMQRYQIAIDNAKTEAEQKRYQAEQDRLWREWQESTRRFNEEMAEKRRSTDLQYKASMASVAQRSAASGSSGGNYSAKKDGSGGYQFYNSSGKKVTMAEYAKGTGTTVYSILQGINTAGAKQALQDLGRMSPNEFRQKYPYIAG